MHTHLPCRLSGMYALLCCYGNQRWLPWNHSLSCVPSDLSSLWGRQERLLHACARTHTQTDAGINESNKPRTAEAFTFRLLVFAGVCVCVVKVHTHYSSFSLSAERVTSSALRNVWEFKRTLMGMLLEYQILHLVCNTSVRTKYSISLCSLCV